MYVNLIIYQDLFASLFALSIFKPFSLALVLSNKKKNGLNLS